MSNKKIEIMKELQQMLTNGPLENLRAQVVEFLRRAKTEENQKQILIELINYVSNFQDQNLGKIMRIINLLKTQKKEKVLKIMLTLKNTIAVRGRDCRKKADEFHLVYNHNLNGEFCEKNIFIKTSEMEIAEEISVRINDDEKNEIKKFIIKSAGEVLDAVCDLRIAVNGK